MVCKPHRGLLCLRAISRALGLGAARAVNSRYFLLLSTECGRLRETVSGALMSQQLDNLSDAFGLFRLLGRKFLDEARHVFEVLVALDWVDKLCLCRSAKEKLRFVFVLTVQQWLRRRVLLLLNLPHELLKTLDRAFESAARLGGLREIRHGVGFCKGRVLRL